MRWTETLRLRALLLPAVLIAGPSARPAVAAAEEPAAAAPPAVEQPLPSATATAEQPAPPAVSGKNCRGEPRGKWLLGESLAGMTQPLGIENQVTLGYCTPLVRDGGVLFDYSNAQVGLANYTSPIYTLTGGFVSVSPLSILNLRAEALGYYMWNIPMDASGYFPLTGYDAPFNASAMPHEQGGSAGGFNANGSATFQFQVDIAPKLSVAVVDSFTVEYWRVGSAPYYYNARRDLPLAREDWLMKNFAVLLFEYEYSADTRLRAGLTDDFSRVPRADYIANMPALLLGAALANWPAGCDLEPFVEVGWITHHAFRKGIVLVGGVGLTLEPFAG